MLITFKELIEKYNINPEGVLHLGASIGQEIKDYYENGVQRTIWVEANPELIPQLLFNLQGYPNHIVFNNCLSDKDGEEVTFHISNNEGQSSSILNLDYHKIAHPEVHYIEDIQLKTKMVSTIFKENDLNIDDYPFVNLDLQGAELLALKGMEDLLSKVKWIYTEVNEKPLYEGCALLPELIEYLGRFGFEMKEKVMAGLTGWGDAIFCRINN